MHGVQPVVKMSRSSSGGSLRLKIIDALREGATVGARAQKLGVSNNLCHQGQEMEKKNLYQKN